MNQLLKNLKIKEVSFWLLFLLLIQKKSQQGIIFEVIPSKKDAIISIFQNLGLFDQIEKEVIYVS
jgi:hypothetical protein